MVLASVAGGADIPIDAVSSAAGDGQSGSYTLGITVGLPVSGVSAGAAVEETVGFWHWLSPFVSGLPDDATPGPLPTSTRLEQNIPNPFRVTTRIRFQVAADAGQTASTKTRLDVFDVTGRRISTLIDGSLVPGYYEATLFRAGSDLPSLASGIYFARLIAGDYRRTIRLVVTN